MRWGSCPRGFKSHQEKEGRWRERNQTGIRAKQTAEGERQPSALRLVCRSSLSPKGGPPLPPLLGQLDTALSPPDPSFPEVSTRLWYAFPLTSCC